MWDWGEDKRQSTLLLRGIDFRIIAGFDLATSQIDPDYRHDYGEPRFQAMGLIDGRLYFVVFTPRGDRVRLIGLRRANASERRAWENR